MATDCIDLKEEFGDKYKIAKDESYFAEYGPTAWTHDPWYLQIPCRLGHIYPHGGSTLAVSLDGHPIKAKQLTALDCCQVHQHGADGMTLLFDMADFQQVAEIVRPHRRVQLSEARKAELAERCRKMNADRMAGRDHREDRTKSTLESPGAPRPDSEHLSGEVAILGA